MQFFGLVLRRRGAAADRLGTAKVGLKRRVHPAYRTYVTARRAGRSRLENNGWYFGGYREVGEPSRLQLHSWCGCFLELSEGGQGGWPIGEVIRKIPRLCRRLPRGGRGGCLARLEAEDDKNVLITVWAVESHSSFLKPFSSHSLSSTCNIISPDTTVYTRASYNRRNGCPHRLHLVQLVVLHGKPLPSELDPLKTSAKITPRETEPQLTCIPQIPVAFMLCMVPHAYAIGLSGKNYDIGK